MDKKISISHAGNLKKDRSYGEQEEDNFLDLASKYFDKNDCKKINKDVVVEIDGIKHQLPDTLVKNIYFENKIKYPTREGLFGLEAYRYNSLISLRKTEKYQNIVYLINPNVRKNTSRTSQAIASLKKFNLEPNVRIGCYIQNLNIDKEGNSYTYRNGNKVWAKVYYFHANQFKILDFEQWSKNPNELNFY